MKAPARLTLLAAALAALFGTARAEDEIADLVTPSSSVTAGVAAASGSPRERSLFGQYNGLREDDAHLLLDVDFVRRDPASGTWTILQARDLGLETRELRAQLDRQGSYKIFGEYWELTRWYPRTINTGLQGAGTTTPVVTTLATRGAGSDLDLKTERKRATAGAEKWLGESLLLEASYTHETKEGARLFGRGFTCPSASAPVPTCAAFAQGSNQWALLMLPEPIDSTTRQFEARATWHGERFTIAAGYYGSFYDNHNGALVNSISGNLVNGLGNPMGQGGGIALTAGLRNILSLPMALPPDNEAHQGYVTGNARLAPSTRMTFKLAYTHATQKDDFLANGLTGAPAGVTNYGGVVDTTLAQVGITSRPWSRVSLAANVRYEDREDKSPLALYNIEGTSPYANGTYSLKKSAAKVEGSYLMGGGTRGVLGFDYEKSDRGQFLSPECIGEPDEPCIGESVGGITALRAQTWEWTVRGELRRSLGESVTGAIIVSHAEREGSSWLKPNALPATGNTPVSDQQVYSRTGIFPFIFMDRERNKLKAMADWSPSEKLSLQLNAEYGKDRYSAPTEKGLDRTTVKLAAIDAAYAINDDWKVSAFYTYSEQGLNVAHSTGYVAFLKDRNSTAGVAVSGKPSPRWQVAADIAWMNDRNIYAEQVDNSASAANRAFLEQSGGLPDVVWRDLRIKLAARFALSRRSELRFDVVHDRQRLNEWTWSNNGQPFFFSDNTTVFLQPRQQVTYVGVGYTYRFR